MPGMNGYDAAIQIREFCDEKNIEQPYIVAITGHTEENYVKKAFECRVDEVMSKPAKIDTIEQILGFAQRNHDVAFNILCLVQLWLLL